MTELIAKVEAILKPKYLNDVFTWNTIKKAIDLCFTNTESISHPENFCQKCNGRNTLWYAHNDLFIKVNGSVNGIICPSCFYDKAKDLGVSIIFKAVIFPEQPTIEQKYDECPECNGTGSYEGKTGGSEGIPEADVLFVCQYCNGTGKISNHE